MAKKQDNLTDKIVGEAIRNLKPGQVTLESKGLVDYLCVDTDNDSESSDGSLVRGAWSWLNKRSWFTWFRDKFDSSGYKGLRLFLLAAMAFMMLVLTIWYAVFFINDVILFESDFQINEQGTLNPRKSLGSEYALFLFNTSEVWANPGIQVNKDDRIRISISGGFHSDICEVLDGAKENKRPKYAWTSPYSDLSEDWRKGEWQLDYLLSRNKENFYFGTVMYTIQPESADISNHPFIVPQEDIYAWEKDGNSFKAKKSGYLFFSVNDLIFDNLGVQTTGSQIRDYYARRRGYLESDDHIAEIEEIKGENNAVLKDPKFLYKDNLGQLLVAVEIQHSIPSILRWPEASFRWFDNHFGWLSHRTGQLETSLYTPSSDGRNVAVSVLCVMLLFIGALLLFFFFGIWNMGIFAVWTAILCVFICLVYLLFRWLLSRISP